mgnify:CR=1 FL=1
MCVTRRFPVQAVTVQSRGFLFLRCRPNIYIYRPWRPAVFSRLSVISSYIKDNSMSSSTQVANKLPWDPNSTKFPSRKDLPKLPDAPDGAAWVWGNDDEVDTVIYVDMFYFMSLIHQRYRWAD